MCVKNDEFCRLVTLQCLHVFWFGLVLQAAKGFIAGGGTGSPDDVREQEEAAQQKKGK